MRWLGVGGSIRSALVFCSAQLFEGNVEARHRDEGPQWMINMDGMGEVDEDADEFTNSGRSAIGWALFDALRNEQRSAMEQLIGGPVRAPR